MVKWRSIRDDEITYLFALLFFSGGRAGGGGSRTGLGLCPCSISKVEQEIDMTVADLGEGLGFWVGVCLPFRNVYFLLTMKDSRWQRGGGTERKSSSKE